MRVVECVPNISEGRRPEVYRRWRRRRGQLPGVTVLDVDPGAETNRTVITVRETGGGSRGGVPAHGRGARAHRHEHAFRGRTRASAPWMLRAVRAGLAGHDGRVRRVRPPAGGARRPRGSESRSISTSRRRPGRTPEPGRRPCRRVRGLGEEAHRSGLAARFRSGDLRGAFRRVGHRRAAVPGRLQRQPEHGGQAARDPDRFRYPREGQKAPRRHRPAGERRRRRGDLRDPGLLAGIKAVGWTIPEFGCAQISINVTDLDATPLHVVFDTCEERARAHGLRVTGSEGVGLVPRWLSSPPAGTISRGWGARPVCRRAP